MSAPPDVLGPANHQLTNRAFQPLWRPNGATTAGDATLNAPLSVSPPREEVRARINMGAAA